MVGGDSTPTKGAQTSFSKTTWFTGAKAPVFTSITVEKISFATTFSPTARNTSSCARARRSTSPFSLRTILFISIRGRYWAWKNDRYVLDNNVYWSAGPGASAAEVRFAGTTLQEWRKRGHDLHSTLAGPLFLAPEEYDFRLQPDSPALRLGFKP